jgi:hypothetical protein
MTLIDEVRALQIPEDCFIIVGSGLLEALHIRPAADIDIIVDADLLDRFAGEGWESIVSDHGKTVLTFERFEMSATWSTPDGEMSHGDLVPGSISIEGVRFIGLPRLLAWKTAMARPKDVADIALIESYLASSEGLDTKSDSGLL